MGSLLGELDINVATFHLGRKSGTEEAVALIEVDGKIDQSVLTKVRELPQVVRADYLQFTP
jgi:D-3-phosphoglycerate dehydrogenase